MKQFKFLLLMLLGVGLLATSCDDDFSEEDLLNAQNDLVNARQDSIKAQNVAALNEAGELVGFQLKVVDTDGNGVEGLTVTMAASLGSGGLDEQTVTTNAAGLALFNRVAIGGNVISVSGGSIIPATLNADFGSIQQGVHYQIVNGVIIPTPVTESAIITVLGASAATATVQGTVTIETDVTNTTTEFPTGVALVADFDDALTQASSLAGLTYFLATNDNVLDLGSADVDATTGAYSMTVPAGVQFDLIVPNVSATQRIAVSRVNNVDLDRPEYLDVATNFGPSWNIFNYSSDFYNIPAVVGVRTVFNAPDPAGEGFTMGSFARVGRSIPTFTFQDGNNFTLPNEINTDIVLQVTNLGSGYTTTPTVAVADGGTGTGATAMAYLEWMYTSATVTTVGTGLVADNDYTVTINYLDEDSNPIFADNFTATANGSGEIGQAEITAGINAGTGPGFEANNWDEIADEVTGFEISFAGGGDGTAVGMGRLERIFMVDTGDDYTSPTFTFSGGGATTQAAISVLQFGTQWTFALDNSGNTVPYALLPDDIEFTYLEVGTGTRDNFTSGSATNIETGSSSDLTSTLLTVDGSGNIVYKDQTASYKTSFFSDEMPSVLVTKGGSIQAVASMDDGDVNEDGSINDIDNIDEEGEGYTAIPLITIEPSAVGAPGSGATATATGGNLLATGEFNWNGGWEITNGGTGYLPNLNQAVDERNYSFPSVSNITLRSGDTRVIDIDFGTGVKGVDHN
ncbi:hypothetical protein [Fulvivirga lutimaris]|uniref:hypothetical protein n=1 Tax=Fulvivirga lutimaris TaxID=1819566 RepID=UPI0012BB4EA0|nr:hypothetical protein [Fulvivirga lutimaris]MTI41377.1 hypothetical protein [Fulvivirga lutimaris]